MKNKQEGNLELRNAELEKQLAKKTRELEIEAALERVRARTMAMQRSDELAETAFILFQQFKELGENPDQATIGIINEEENVIEYWVTMYGSQVNKVFKFSIDEPNVTNKIYKAWKAKEKSLVIDLSGKALLDFTTYRASMGGAGFNPAEKRRVINVAFFSNGIINVQSNEERSAESIRLLERFAGVFESTYTRFLDLKKAEAQTRESQIQLALERVRARTMAMQNSEELHEVIQLIFEQFQQLNFDIDVANFALNYKETEDFDLVIAVPHGKYPMKIRVPYFQHPVFDRFNKAKKDGGLLADVFTKMEKDSFFKYFFNYVPGVPEETKAAIFGRPGFVRSTALMKNTALTIHNYNGIPYSQAENNTLLRFGQVFEQTYTRFTDLEQAEAQARESQIQLGLERVRAKAMAMQTSEELNELIGSVFSELTRLDFVLTRCLIMIFDPETDASRWWMANSEAPAEPMNYLVQNHKNPAYDAYLEAWKERNLKWNYTLKGKVKRDWDDFLFVDTELAQLPRPVIEGMKAPQQVLLSASFNNFGCLTLVSLESLSEEHSDIMLRFAKVFDMCYTRFNDLQKAEEQAREAIKQASVDRVRGEIASMRSTEDLDRITPLIWNELTILGIPFIRCGVFIIDEEEQLIHTHLSTADGKALATFDLRFDSQGIGQNVLPAWRQKQAATIHWSAEEFAEYTKNLVEQGSVKSRDKYVTEHPDISLDLHFLPFLQGMLYVGNVTPLTKDELDLVQSLAYAFSTAYARYEDFNKLEAAKQQVENTLTDLKATQTRLIQSEKMASLGELTAGIAHEIQNPLNFVNNFSEVNQEMIDELADELKAGNIEEALAIAADIKDNEQKINHHGKRADGIVKGMLQHSRTGGGEKTPTNINALADEFIRLSYHGLRAKDKVFNAELVTHFDPDLPKISVIGQDIGRVLLNLFNNAFYAVNQKKKALNGDYKPEVTVTTLTENGHVIIKVKDNGTGMPDAIKEKIMQPFFTTKPTGEGTGLGLSLTYDMVVKGHGGTIQVNSKEGEYSEFIISLPLS